MEETAQKSVCPPSALAARLLAAAAEGVAANVRRWLRFIGWTPGVPMELQAIDVPRNGPDDQPIRPCQRRSRDHRSARRGRPLEGAGRLLHFELHRSRGGDASGRRGAGMTRRRAQAPLTAISATAWRSTSTSTCRGRRARRRLTCSSERHSMGRMRSIVAWLALLVTRPSPLACRATAPRCLSRSTPSRSRG